MTKTRIVEMLIIGASAMVPTLGFAQTGSVTCLFKGWTEPQIVEFDSKQKTVVVDGTLAKFIAIDKRYISYYLRLGGADFETNIDRLTGTIVMKSPIEDRNSPLFGHKTVGSCEKTRQKF